MTSDENVGSELEWEQVVHGLGLVCIEFQFLETLIKAAIGELVLSELVAKDDRVFGSLITAGLTFKASADLLYALFEYRWEGSSRPKELKAILGRCVKAEEKRNQLIHSSWYEPTTRHGVTRVKFTTGNQKGLRVQHEIMTPTRMENIAGELRTCRKELASYLFRILHPDEDQPDQLQ